MEVPAGGLSPDLAPEEVARRELLEEVGGMASELRCVGQFYTSNGISNEAAYVYLATGVELSEAYREPTEFWAKPVARADGDPPPPHQRQKAALESSRAACVLAVPRAPTDKRPSALSYRAFGQAVLILGGEYS